MALRDEIKKERQTVRQGTLKKKLQYFKDYYLGRTVITAVVTVLVISVIVSIAASKKIVLSGVMLNRTVGDLEDPAIVLAEDYLNKQGLDPNEAEVELISNLSYTIGDSSRAQENYATIEVLWAKISGGLLDFVTGDLESVSMFAYSECFTDLREVLNEEQQAMYEPYFLYIDLAVIDQLEDIASSEQYDIEVEVPDHRTPEQMKQPVPVLLDVSKWARVQSLYPDDERTLVLAVAANAPDQERLMQFIEFLMTEE